MRKVATKIRRAVGLLAILFIVASTAYADDPPSPGESPEARIKPPTGTEARIKPPTSEPRLFQQVLVWLRAHARYERSAK